MRLHGPINAVYMACARPATRQSGPQKRRVDGTHGARDEAERPQKRCVVDAHEARDEDTRTQKRRADATHDPIVDARSPKRRVDGTREPVVAARPQKRRVDGTHENARAREMRRDVTPPPGHRGVATDLALRRLFYGSGVT